MQVHFFSTKTIYWLSLQSIEIIFDWVNRNKEIDKQKRECSFSSDWLENER